jgi:hypothetical protein
MNGICPAQINVEDHSMLRYLDSLSLSVKDSFVVDYEEDSDFLKLEEERMELRQNWINEQNLAVHRADALIDLTYSYLFENLDSVQSLNAHLLRFCKATQQDTALLVAYNYQGFYLQEIGDYWNAMKYYRLSQKKAELLKDTAQLAGVLVNMASLYEGLSEIDKSTALNNRALDMFRDLENLKGQGLILLNLGSQSKDPALSVQYTRMAIDIFENKFEQPYENNQIAWFLPTCYSNLAVHFEGDSLHQDSSFYYYRKGLDHAIRYQINNQISGCLGGLSSLYYRLEQYEIALQYATKSYEFASKANYIKDIVLSTDILYKVQKSIGNNEAALNFFEEHKKFKDSLNGIEENLQLLKADFQRDFHQLRMAEDQQQLKERLLLLLVILLIALPVFWWTRKKYRLLFDEKAVLLKEIKELKDKNMFKAIATETPQVKGVMLNKAKLESHINNKLNETDWKILNLLYDDPIIMNKIIAQEVSLSVEGVSSSLRKMYRLFVIKDGKNKKIALLLESIRISSNN